MRPLAQWDEAYLEWIENVLTTGVQPKLEHLEIVAVDLPSKGKDRVAFVIRIGHPFHQMPFRANPIKCLEEHRPKQLLRCDRGATEARIELAELPRKITQRRIRQISDHP
jgi:hypothetical protein